MTDKEMKEVLGLALEGVSLKIEKKCGFIADTCASYSNINDLNKLIQQFLKLREKWNAILYDDED
ncbi:MAG: hypothetical protein NC177_07685 [Ruminococcus flavefaciens]|nr:hypothetical protein [Ruminococcus flavefaciens]